MPACLLQCSQELGLSVSDMRDLLEKPGTTNVSTGKDCYGRFKLSATFLVTDVAAHLRSRTQDDRACMTWDLQRWVAVLAARCHAVPST